MTMETDYRTAAPAPADPTLPRMSVLVMGHNQQEFMAACLDSVLSQHYDGWVEVILCDDCSTDATFDIMLQKAKQYRGPFRVVAHRCPVNGRVAVNMNIAVSLSEGDWLVRVDGDDIMHPDRLRLTALAIRRFPGATGVSGALSVFSGEPAPVTNPPDSELAFLVASKDDYRNGGEPEGLRWWGGASAFSRRIFTEFGDMPAECAVLDDTMLATRVLVLGQYVIIRNGYMIYYRRHAGNISSAGQSDKSFRSMLEIDAAGRDYLHRGLVCHAPILAELKTRARQDSSCQPMAQRFEALFGEWRRQAFFWQKSWRERIADAHIKGPWWRKIPWALRVVCPHTYVFYLWLQARLKK